MTDSIPSLPRRVGQLLFSPAKLFEALAERPVWIGALVLGAVIGATGAVLLPGELYEVGIREQMLRADRPVPDNLASLGTMTRVFGSIAALIVSPLITTAMAGIVAFIFIFILGDNGTFKQHLASVSHAFLVASLSTVLLVPLKILAEDAQLRLSVGTFLPFLNEGWLASALGWLDLFALWAWVLVALGASRIDRERSWASATAVLLAIVVVVTFTVTGIGVLRS